MIIQCPLCHSTRVVTRNTARKVGCVAGTIGGAASGAASMMTTATAGAEIGLMTGLLAGPVISRDEGLYGTVITTLCAAVACAIAGATLGQLIDDQVLDNYACSDCGHTFSLPGVMPPVSA